MKRSLRIRTFAAACLAAVPALLLAAVAVSADELDAGSRPGGFTIIGPEQTLRDYCSTDGDGRLWFEIPGGMRFELVTSTADPVISNPGDGAFHPFDETEVRARAYEAVKAAGAEGTLEETAEILYRAPLRVKVTRRMLVSWKTWRRSEPSARRV